MAFKKLLLPEIYQYQIENFKMTFLEIKNKFEHEINQSLELLEMNYAPYAFGSGMIAYRINGIIIKIIYDGKENQVQLLRAKEARKYSTSLSWVILYVGVPADLFIHQALLNIK